MPDLKLRADVAVEVMGLTVGKVPHRDVSGVWTFVNDETGLVKCPEYELSLDSCREVLAEIERRGLALRFTQIIVAALEPNACIKYGWEWAFFNATAADICRAALAAVREAKEKK